MVKSGFHVALAGDFEPPEAVARVVGTRFEHGERAYQRPTCQPSISHRDAVATKLSEGAVAGEAVVAPGAASSGSAGWRGVPPPPTDVGPLFTTTCAASMIRFISASSAPPHANVPIAAWSTDM